MNARTRFLLATAVLMLLMTGPFLLTVLVVYLDMPPADRDNALRLLLPHLPLGTFLTVSGFLLGLLVVRRLFRQYVKGLQQMAEQLRLMHAANRNFRIAIEGPPEVQALAAAANQLASQRDALLTDVDEQISLARKNVEDEKNRIAALLSHLAVGILVFNPAGVILLYNRRAQHQLRAAAVPGGQVDLTPVGLGRSIHSLFHRGVLGHAQKSIEEKLSAGRGEPVALFTTASRSGLLLRVHMAPVLATDRGDSPVVTGYVLSVENITARQEHKAQRAQALHMLSVDNGASLTRVRDALQELLPESAPGTSGRLESILAGELVAMQSRIDQGVAQLHGDEGSAPRREMLTADLIAAASRRIANAGVPVKQETVDETLWVKVDGFTILHTLSFIAAQLKEHYAIRELRLATVRDNDMAAIDVIWSGLPMSSEVVFTWELEPMVLNGRNTSTTLRDVLNRHGGELRYQRDTASHQTLLRLALPLVPPPADIAEAMQTAPAGRPEFYDFDLFNLRNGGPLLDQPLASLACTVFDTETTGLDPSRDEIIQFGAVRILNSRVLVQEVFEQLIDPGCPIPETSRAIHGIDDAMVRGQPAIDQVLPAFHTFCSDTALVAHNAAFDMRFLAMKERSCGVRFDHPVLDTLLLSAVVHPGQDRHGIEDIALRMGVPLQTRHAALSDALMTAEIFVRLIPLLAEQGIVTLRQALAASQKTWYARIRY